MSIRELFHSLTQRLCGVVDARTAPEFIQAARALCETARDVNFARSYEVRPEARLLREACATLREGAGVIRQKLSEFDLPPEQAGLLREFADHIVERAVDIEEEASMVERFDSGMAARTGATALA
jgi:hypothetical protein